MQDSVIARQEEEMSGLKVQIGGLQQQLTVAADCAIDLTLKSSGQRCLHFRPAQAPRNTNLMVSRPFMDRIPMLPCCYRPPSAVVCESR